jgi:hypothetical protein
LYFGKEQIYEELGIPFFPRHITALTEGFDSKLADAGNPSVGNLEGTCADRPLAEIPQVTEVK